MNKKFVLAVAMLLCVVFVGAFADEVVEAVPAAVEAVAEPAVEEAKADNGASIKYLAAAIAVAIACLAGAMAVGKIGAAAMGAMSENADLSGKALPFVGLAEGICLWGFLVALLILFV